MSIKIFSTIYCPFDENILPMIVSNEPTLVPNRKANVDMSNLPMTVRYTIERIIMRIATIITMDI